jgi:hypothetical protein
MAHHRPRLAARGGREVGRADGPGRYRLFRAADEHDPTGPNVGSSATGASLGSRVKGIPFGPVVDHARPRAGGQGGLEMTDMGFQMTNYNGGFALRPKPSPKGRFVLRTNGTWQLEFKGDNPIQAGLSAYEIAIAPEQSGSRVTMTRASETASFSLPRTPPDGLRWALETHTFTLPGPDDQKGWWSDIPAGRLSGVAHKGVGGSLTIDAAGITWRAIDSGAGVVRFSWPAVSKINIETITHRTAGTRKRSAFGIGPIGLAVVAGTAIHNARAKPGTVTVYQKLTLTDGKGAAYEFMTAIDRPSVDRILGPVFSALRASNVPKPVAPTTIGIADELKKLVELRDAGVLTAEEFDSQKARLLEQR